MKRIPTFVSSKNRKKCTVDKRKKTVLQTPARMQNMKKKYLCFFFSKNALLLKNLYVATTFPVTWPKLIIGHASSLL